MIRDISVRKQTETELGIERERLKTALEDLQQSRLDLEEALEREKHFSLLLQRALLPAEPSLGRGYHIAVGYVPFSLVAKLGEISMMSSMRGLVGPVFW